MTDRPTIVQVAKLLTKSDEVPDWLLFELCSHVPLIQARKAKPGDGDENLAIAAIDVLEEEIAGCQHAVETYKLEADDRFDDASKALEELRDFFEEQQVPRGGGGPVPDRRRNLCAAVCAKAWERLYGNHQPYSAKLRDACEAYWRACGHAETSSQGRLKNWERFLTTPQLDRK